MDWGRSEEKLRALAAQGLSARQIASQFVGVTRNAVIGQMKRRGIDLAGRRGGQRDTVAPLPEPSGQPEPILSGMAAHHPTPPAVGEESRDTSVSTLELRRDSCRWPTNNGEAGVWLHCGAHAPHGPYCSEHRKRSYSASHPRRSA